MDVLSRPFLPLDHVGRDAHDTGSHHSKCTRGIHRHIDARPARMVRDH